MKVSNQPLPLQLFAHPTYLPQVVQATPMEDVHHAPSFEKDVAYSRKNVPIAIIRMTCSRDLEKSSGIEKRLASKGLQFLNSMKLRIYLTAQTIGGRQVETDVLSLSHQRYLCEADPITAKQKCIVMI